MFVPNNSSEMVIDWTASGAVTGVVDQMICGAGWATGVTGALEGMFSINTKNLVNLSIQQLVDCTGAFGNYGCNGGFIDGALRYF